MKNINIKILFLFNCIYFVSIPTVYATHAAGMDISFECIARNSTSDFYKITVSFYRDCNNTACSRKS
jgi:hypothetical protein